MKKLANVSLIVAVVLSVFFVSCVPIADIEDYSESENNPFFTLTVRSSGETESTRAITTVKYEPVVTWKSEQGFRDTVTKFEIKVGDEEPISAKPGDAITSRRIYPVGKNISVTYIAYGKVLYSDNKGESITKTEIIASETKTVTVAAKGTKVHFKVSEGIKDVSPFTEEVETVTGKVIYDYGDAKIHGNKTGLPVDDGEYETGDSFEVKNSDDMEWVHGTFTGWVPNVPLEPSNGGSAVELVTTGSYKMPDGGVVLTAKWNKNSYTVSYEKNAPANSSVTATVTTWPTEIATPASIQALSSVKVFNGASPEISAQFDGKNWRFVGWKDGDGNSYSPGDTITQLTNNVTLYAQWSDKNVYTITFATESSGNVPQPSDFTQELPGGRLVEEGATSESWTNPAADGYEFSGWKITKTDDSSDLGSQGTITNFSPQANVTLTAQWIPITYKVHFDGNGSDGGNMADQEYTYGIEQALSQNQFTLTGKRFVDWKLQNDNNTTYSDMQSVKNLTKIKGSVVTLVAQWENVPAYPAYINNSPRDDFQTAWSEANSTANCVLKLGQNVEIKNKLQVTSPFTLDLNGYTIDGKSATNLIEVKANFTVKDDSANKDGKLTGGSYGNGGAIIVNSGTSGNYIKFTLESGKITGNNSTSGGNVYLNSYAEFIMNGGQITDNDAGNYSGGAAVYMSNNTKFTMTAGDITGNRSASNGGAIYCNGTGAEISIEGGTISGNTATTSGGGIYLLDGTLTVKGGQISGNNAGTSAGGIYVGSSTTFNISGNINIQGNKQTESNSSQTDSNVYLNGLAKINVTGTLDNASRIGVRLADYSSITSTAGRTITSGINGKDTASNFTDDYESVAGTGLGWKVEADANDNGEIALKQR